MSTKHRRGDPAELAIEQQFDSSAPLRSVGIDTGYFILLQLPISSHELGQRLQRLCELVANDSQYWKARTIELASAYKLTPLCPLVVLSLSCSATHRCLVSLQLS